MLNYGQHPLNALSLDTHSNVPAAIAHMVRWQDAVGKGMPTQSTGQAEGLC